MSKPKVSADPQKLGPTTATYMDGPVPSMRYKTPRPYSDTPIQTVRSLVAGAETRGWNYSRPPTCTGNHGRNPAPDFDKRTVRVVDTPEPAKPAGKLGYTLKKGTL